MRVDPMTEMRVGHHIPKMVGVFLAFLAMFLGIVLRVHVLGGVAAAAAESARLTVPMLWFGLACMAIAPAFLLFVILRCIGRSAITLSPQGVELGASTLSPIPWAYMNSLSADTQTAGLHFRIGLDPQALTLVSPKMVRKDARGPHLKMPATFLRIDGRQVFQALATYARAHNPDIRIGGER